MQAQTVQLNDIALFVEVAKRKSFSLAARALDMPTSTLSRRINQLEKAIGLRLINRNTRRLELTDAGMVYLQRCQGLIDETRLAREQLESLTGRPKGRLNISMPYSLAIWLLPTSLGAFLDSYPEIDCEFDLNLNASATSQGAPSTSSCASGATAATTKRRIPIPWSTKSFRRQLPVRLGRLSGPLRRAARPRRPGPPRMPAHGHRPGTFALDAAQWRAHRARRGKRPRGRQQHQRGRHADWA